MKDNHRVFSLLVFSVLSVPLWCNFTLSSSRSEETKMIRSSTNAEKEQLTQPENTWVKRSPLPDASTSPRLGYEGACAWDSRHHVLIRYGGHNQGGGGEQNSELWTFDPITTKWTLKEPNTSPPGLCCAQQNVFDTIQNRYIRFPAFSGSHGWQWFREIYLNNSSVWNYDLGTNIWRNLRPLPEPHVRPLRCAAWDSDHQVIVVFGGEGSTEGTLVYDPYANTWTWMNPEPQPDFRSGGNMAHDAAHKLHILFGAQFTDDPHTWAYDLRENEWRDLEPAEMPPTNENDAVLTYDTLNKVIIALVRTTVKEGNTARHSVETWGFDAGRNTWTKMNPPREPDPEGSRRRVLNFAPELGLAILENRVHPPQGEAEQQIWTYRFADPEPDTSPLPPTDLSITTEADSAILSWQYSPSPNVSHYVIYRGTGDHPWQVRYREIATVSAQERSYRDNGLKQGTVYFYTVRAASDSGPGAESMKVRTQPPVVEDIVVSVLSEKEVLLTWTPPETEDVKGYYIERAVVEVFSEDQIQRLKKDTPPLAEPSVGAISAIGDFSRLNEDMVKQPKYTDTSLDLTQPQKIQGELLYKHRFRADHLDENGKPYRYAVYAYRIRAVNALGVQSGPSPYSLTIPSAPQWLFSREESRTCHLKWAANPERKLKGYRIYRIEGPRINGPGQSVTRLSPDVITANHYTDVNDDEETLRYHVVAVDALGQEGFPSSPVWFHREWKRFYLPFIEEWHQ